jgi:hypothetical protein
MSSLQDLDLGEFDSEEDAEFPPPERKVVTQSYDLSMQVLLDQWNHATLVVPEIQREYVWDNGKASRLAESLLLNIPIPVLYFAETPDAKWEIVDGHQRVRSVIRFLENEFRLTGLQVLTEFKGLRFHQLPDRERRFLERRTMRAVVISPESHPNMKFEVFSRLNTGAVALNTQEIRNALYAGVLNKLLKELVSDECFRSSIGTRTPRRRFVDEELILRFFALRADLNSYRPPLSRFLNEFMNQNRNPQRAEVQRLKALFDTTFGRIANILGERAFRLTDRGGNLTERNVNRALFEAQALAFSWVTASSPVPARSKVFRELAKVYANDDFDDSIRRATGDRARTLTRLRGIVAALREAGFRLRPPALWQ